MRGCGADPVRVWVVPPNRSKVHPYYWAVPPYLIKVPPNFLEVPPHVRKVPPTSPPHSQQKTPDHVTIRCKD